VSITFYCSPEYIQMEEEMGRRGGGSICEAKYQGLFLPKDKYEDQGLGYLLTKCSHRALRCMRK